MRMLSLVLAIVLLLVIFSVASAFSFTPFMSEEMHGPKRISFIVLLWLYGSYRSYRLFVLLKGFKL